jgi:hypothetical protein
LSQTEQFERYKNRVNQVYHELANQSTGNGTLATQQGLSTAMAGSDVASKTYVQNDRIDQAADLTRRSIQAVDFPKFVADLLKGVFDANLDVTQKQMDSYAQLVDRIVKPAKEFISSIDDDVAMMTVAQRYGNRFKLQPLKLNATRTHASAIGGGSSSSKKTDASSATMKLVNLDGSEADNAEVQSKIMEAKLELVEKHQRLLEEMLLMGVTRLVVDKGVVKATVDFHLTAVESIGSGIGGQEERQHDQLEADSEEAYARMQAGGLFWSASGGGSMARSHRDVQSLLQISTAQADGSSDTTSDTKLHGEVEINFKSDYFSLNNFKEILMSDGRKKAAPEKAKGQTQTAPVQEAPIQETQDESAVPATE